MPLSELIHKIIDEKHLTWKSVVNKIKRNKDLYNELISYTSFLSNNASISERLYCFKEHVISLPVCPKCNTPLHFIKINLGYKNTCINCGEKRIKLNQETIVSNLTLESIQKYKEFALSEDNKVIKGTTYPSVVEKKFPEIYQYCKGEFYKEKLYMLLYNIHEHPKCSICNKLLSLKDFNSGFRKTCSVNCSNELQRINIIGKDFSYLQTRFIKTKQVETTLQRYFPNLNCDYDYPKKEIIFKNYCKHGDLHFKYNLINVLKKRYDNGNCLCKQCNEEFIRNYVPTENEIKKFQQHINEFRKKHAQAFNKDWFIQYYPKEYKIIDSWVNNPDLLFIQKLVLFSMNLKEVPECSISGCNCKVKWAYNRNYLYDRCQEHINVHVESKPEKEIKEYIDSLGISYISNNRKILNGKELDIYIHEYKLAIEYNGLYYHSEQFKEKHEHFNKWKQCKEKGIKLMTIWEHDWNSKKEIIKCIIKQLLRLSEKIDVEQCTVKEIASELSNKFLIENCIIDKTKSSVQLGLFYNDNLMGVMTLGKWRFNRNISEIINFCIHKDYIIDNGFNKLLEFYIEKYNINNIVFYCNCSFPNYAIYEDYGFKNTHSDIKYWWCNHKEVLTKYQINKRIDKDKTEYEVMKEHGYYKVWDCGHLKYELEI